MTPRLISSRLGAGIAVILLLAGCTTFSKDGGFDAVTSTAKERLGKDAVMVKTDADRDSIAKRTQALLSQPLSIVRLADPTLADTLRRDSKAAPPGPSFH